MGGSRQIKGDLEGIMVRIFVLERQCGLIVVCLIAAELVRAPISCTEGREFESWLSQIIDLQSHYLSLNSVTLDNTRKLQGLVSSVSG